MKRSNFLSIAAVLFAGLFWNCADLSVSKQEALEAELPDGFDWKEYALINKDVPGSQIVYDIQKRLTVYSEFKTDSLKKLIEDCLAILENLDFAGKIYLEYANCPKIGWDENSACTGAYANNPNYTIVKGQDTTCNIKPCWAGGWDEPFDCGDEICPGTKEPFKESLEFKIADYKNSGITRPTTFFTTEREIYMLCRFILPRAESSESAENYLKNFYSYGSVSNSLVFGSSIDSILIKQHYFLVGRSEGRPYKHCRSGAYDPEIIRNDSLALGFKTPQGHTFYDYGQHLFCLNECEDKTQCDGKIYLLKEK